MKYFFDTEFIEDGRTIDLISIGIVAEDGKQFYAVSSEFDASKANEWVKKHVLSYLECQPHIQPMSRNEIKEGILKFVDDKPEFYAYYADYDWVSMCQLFGQMIDLPAHFPMFCRDIKQTATELEFDLPKQLYNCHHAINDALWVKDSYYLMQEWVNS